MLIIGIDPGLTGGIAALWGREILAVKDMPVSAKLYGKGDEVNCAELASILMDMRVAGKPVRVILEQVGSMPGQGVASMFSFGDSNGAVRGVCGTLQYPVDRATPQEWKKRAGILLKGKDAARTLAINRHPEISGMLSRKLDIGRADAICIAEFGTN
jgi:crossover junction endodeoxyribonuclease RuvC